MSLLIDLRISILIFCVCAVLIPAALDAQSAPKSEPDFVAARKFIEEAVHAAALEYANLRAGAVQIHNARSGAHRSIAIHEPLPDQKSATLLVSMLVRPRHAMHRELPAFQRDIEATLRELGHIPTTGGDAAIFGRQARTRDYASAQGPSAALYATLGPWNLWIIVQQRGFEARDGGANLSTRLRASIVSHLAVLSLPWNADSQPIADPMAAVASAHAVVRAGRALIVCKTPEGEPVSWRGIPVQIAAYNARGERMELAMAHDSISLSGLGAGVELPTGLKRLELRGPSGNLIDVPIPPWRLPE